MLSYEGQGIHERTSEAIMNCDARVRNDLSCNVCLSGGNTLFPGLKERFTKELALELRALGLGITDQLLPFLMSTHERLGQNCLQSVRAAAKNPAVRRLIASFMSTVRVTARPDRQFSVWTGGVLLASLSLQPEAPPEASFEHTWLLHQDFEDNRDKDKGPT